MKAAHLEITRLELAATKPGKGCQTIVATETAEIGQACDQDKWAGGQENKRSLRRAGEAELDVTLPIHRSSGKIITTAGMDFRREAGRTKETVVHEALKIAAELERRLTSERELFRTAQKFKEAAR